MGNMENMKEEESWNVKPKSRKFLPIYFFFWFFVANFSKQQL